ncbi:MAG TPA: hypothetical protein VNK04_03955 [Gemmataceae bacterium]|nr:hypothetical protein [Gemmataceae bacterium]
MDRLAHMLRAALAPSPPAEPDLAAGLLNALRRGTSTPSPASAPVPRVGVRLPPPGQLDPATQRRLQAFVDASVRGQFPDPVNEYLAGLYDRNGLAGWKAVFDLINAGVPIV